MCKNQKVIDMLYDIRASLDAADIQSLPTDDEIIMGHVRTSSKQLTDVISMLTEEQFEEDPSS